MKIMVWFLNHIYAMLVRLYPRSFRGEFEEEMRLVFAEAVIAAAREGRAALIGLGWREFRDWPQMLLAEYWFSIKAWNSQVKADRVRQSNNSISQRMNWRQVMSDQKQHRGWCIPNRRQAIMAALPPLLLGLGIVAVFPVRGGPWHAVPTWRLILSVVVGLMPAAVIGGGALIALVRHLPDWGYTWIGAALMGLLLLVKTITEELAEEGRFLISPLEGPVVGISILLIVGVALVAAAWRGWPQAGLMSIGLSSIVGLSLCSLIAVPPFNRSDLALLAAPAGLLSAALVYVYARRSDVVRIAVFLGLWLLNTGLVWLANQVWQAWLLPRGRPTPFWPLLVITTGLLLAGPLLSLLGWPLRRTLGRT